MFVFMNVNEGGFCWQNRVIP